MTYTLKEPYITRPCSFEINNLDAISETCLQIYAPREDSDQTQNLHWLILNSQGYNADNEDYDQTTRIRMLICVFWGRRKYAILRCGSFVYVLFWDLMEFGKY